jgi:hypothetical protein
MTAKTERLCAEADYRASLSEDDFWAYVLSDTAEEPQPFDEDLDATTNQNEPCPECGEYGQCGYDMEGRPMIHVTTDDDEGQE